MGKFAKASAPIGMKFVDLEAGRIAQAKTHNLTEINAIRFPIELLFSSKLNGVQVPLTFLLTWKFALKAKADLASLVQEASQQNRAKRAGATAERFSSASIFQPRSHFVVFKTKFERKKKVKAKKLNIVGG